MDSLQTRDVAVLGTNCVYLVVLSDDHIKDLCGVERGDASELNKMLEVVSPFEDDDRAIARREKHIHPFVQVLKIRFTFKPLNLEHVPPFFKSSDAF